MTLHFHSVPQPSVYLFPGGAIREIGQTVYEPPMPPDVEPIEARDDSLDAATGIIFSMFAAGWTAFVFVTAWVLHGLLVR